VLTCRSLDALATAAAGTPVELFFKCELFQVTGSFKARGATNAVLSLPPGAAAVCTHSSGNHAAALAYAARVAGLPAHIVMPSNAPGVKREAVAGYGGIITECAPTQAAREAAAAGVVASTGAVFVHPSEDPAVIAGQGTLALELLAQVPPRPAAAAAAAAAAGDDARPPPPLDVLVVPVGGGGMISGVAVAAKGAHPGGALRVIGAEPAGADDAARSKATGVLQGHAPGGPVTVADGLRTTLGPHTFPVVRDLVDGVLTVTEDEIVAALRLVYSRMKLAIEPSAAVGVAAVLSPRFAAALAALAGSEGAGGSGSGRPLRVGVVLCGGNADLATLPLA
jgi:threonine dehydratase